MRQSKRSWACVLLLALLFLSACAGQGESKEETSVPQAVEPVGKVYYAYFDTVSYVYDYAGDSAERFDDRSAEVSHILEEYHQLFDIYHEYSGVVNLCTLNKNAGGEALEVDPRLVEFLVYAKDMYTLTDGEMNVMLGAVLRLWHDCRENAAEDPANAAIPGEDALREAYTHTDIDLLEIDTERNTVRIADPSGRRNIWSKTAPRAMCSTSAATSAASATGRTAAAGSRPSGIRTTPPRALPAASASGTRPV